MSDFSNEVNEYMPLRDVVFKTLRQAILKGDMVPGERLMEIQLAKKLGVSRTPIREAIRKLELEGLVTMVPRKGAEVAGITEKNLCDVLEVRRALEELAIELACERIHEDMVTELVAAERDFKDATAGSDAIKIARMDEKFHDIIFQATENDKLVQMLNNLREQMYLYRLVYIKYEKTRHTLFDEHEEFIYAIQSRQVSQAKSAIRSHIDNQEVTISKNIKEA